MQGYGLDRAGLGQGQMAGTCDFGNEPSGSIKCGEVLDQVKTGQLLKKGSAPWSMGYKVKTLQNWYFYQNMTHIHPITKTFLLRVTVTQTTLTA